MSEKLHFWRESSLGLILAFIMVGCVPESKATSVVLPTVIVNATEGMDNVAASDQFYPIEIDPQVLAIQEECGKHLEDIVLNQDVNVCLASTTIQGETVWAGKVDPMILPGTTFRVDAYQVIPSELDKYEFVTLAEGYVLDGGVFAVKGKKLEGDWNSTTLLLNIGTKFAGLIGLEVIGDLNYLLIGGELEEKYIIPTPSSG